MIPSCFQPRGLNSSAKPRGPAAPPDIKRCEITQDSCFHICAVGGEIKSETVSLKTERGAKKKRRMHE